MKEQESLNIDEDVDAVNRCIKGDVDAFEEIVRKYQKKMFNISHRLLGDYNEAAEVVQDAFMSAYRNIRGFKGESRFSTWLCSIVLNLSRNKLKQMRTRSYREDCSLDDPIDTEEGRINIDPPSGDLSVLEKLERHEVSERVRKCIDTLEGGFREVIVLRDLQGFSYDEISDMLSLAIGTVRSRLHRSRMNVRECLKKFVGAVQHGMQ
jgi:RNA polymerase sigma-70 factor (ECF subfamily)